MIETLTLISFIGLLVIWWRPRPKPTGGHTTRTYNGQMTGQERMLY